MTLERLAVTRAKTKEAIAKLDATIETHKTLKDGTAAIVPGPKVHAYEHPERVTASDNGADEAPQPAGPMRRVALDYDRTRLAAYPKTMYLKAGEALAYDFGRGRWVKTKLNPGVVYDWQPV